MNRAPIGIIGGMGPHAGLLLAERVMAWTRASLDQEHVPIALLSFPGRIPDRSAFLNGTGESPARAIASVANDLYRIGVRVAGIPCNTAHAPEILQDVTALLGESAPGFRLLHLIDETVRHIREQFPQISRVGVLATEGTYRSGMYQHALEQSGLKPLLPPAAVRAECVHAAIYDPARGLKAVPSPATPWARERLLQAIENLASQGAECVILGCTELPLAFSKGEPAPLPLVDSVDVLARALLRDTFPQSLKSHVTD